jgi:ribosomal protein S18 acetylase RimI-like enzyme
MAMRPFKLPDDFDILLDVIPRSFQYPDNPEWSVQPDEMESLEAQVKGIRQIWPLIRVAKLLSPPFRDIMRGFIWEEDGKAVGLVNFSREGATDTWEIGNVSVLPAYRRRGIARKLVEASLEMLRERGARRVTLDVIDANAPAYALYQKLGFEQFSGTAECEYTGAAPPDVYPLPDEYAVEPLGLFDWRPRYELARRVTPDRIQAYRPVEEKRYRSPPMLRVIMPVLSRVMSVQSKQLLVKIQASGQVVAVGGHQTHKRAGGVSEARVFADPAHPAPIRHLISDLTRQVRAINPETRVQFSAPQWNETLAAAAEAAGFAKRCTYHKMGLVL